MLEFKSVEFQQDLTRFFISRPTIRRGYRNHELSSYREDLCTPRENDCERAGFSARHEHDPKFSILAISKWPISKKTVLPPVRLAIAHAVRVIEIGRV